MRLRLYEGERVLFDLDLPDLSREVVSPVELAKLEEGEVERLCALLSIGSNPKRLSVMMELANGQELRFSDVMQIAMNPKIARDCLQPMLREGLVVHGERGSTYRVSPKAVSLLMTLTVGLSKMLSHLQEEGSASTGEGTA